MSGGTWPRRPPEGAGSDTGRPSSCIVPVVALHCSGADGRQWDKLAAVLGPRFEVIAPSFFGVSDVRPWSGERSFTLADEAEAVIELIDAAGTGVHLIGHSYGGGVALKAASMRPAAIASLSLYEPSAFHILRQLGASAAPDLAEIEALAASVGTGVVSGAYREASATFVDYWNGEGAWQALRAEVRDELVRWLPKAPLDFRALLGDDTDIATYRSIACPTLLMRGAHARGPSRRIVDALSNVMTEASVANIGDAGHMGPLSHAQQTNDLIARHIDQVIRSQRQGEGRSPQAA